MADAHRRLMRRAGMLALAGAAATLWACASPNASSRKTPADAGSSAAAAAAASGRDWHTLVIVPFGTLLKDVPYRLGEIVMFHDSSGVTAGREERDCHALQGASPPAFFGRPVAEYALCFSSDRLNRVEASVSLPADSASAQFAAACMEWQHHATAVADAPDRCAVKDGGTTVEARLDASEGSDGTLLSIALDAQVPVRDADP
jgi:hypothetical protein